MAGKNVILQMMLEEVLTDLMVQTGADNVIIDSASKETLATRLSKIASDIQGLNDSAMTQEQVQQTVSTAIDALIGGAPETYDTLKELADYITQHEDVVKAINAAIGNKVDKEEGKGLSTNDFTNALLTKLNGIAANATKVEASTNGKIKINGVDTNVYAHPTGDGNNHLPKGGKVGQVLRANGSGQGSWGENVRSGASAPSDLAAGELFIKVL